MQVKTELHPVAKAAHRAAVNWNMWGKYAAYRYAVKRNVPVSLLTTARVLANAAVITPQVQ